MGNDERKWTPGPWSVELEDRLMVDGMQVSAPEKDRIAYVQPDDTMEIEGGRIVECCSREQKANARLIAAAPEMYEALSEFLEINDDLHRRGSMPAAEADERRYQATRKMRAALARADGKVAP